MIIKYISHGKHVTGGYMHEKFLFETLTEYYKCNKKECNPVEKRNWEFFEGFRAHLILLFWAFKEAHADINLTVSRLALPVIIRNLFNTSKTLVVLHNYDPHDGKNISLKMYYFLLFTLLKFAPKSKVAVITVARYWENYFKIKKGVSSVFLFPNFFDSKQYVQYLLVQKNKTIYMGQYSLKNDKKIFELAKQLHQLGYSCYFSTNNKNAAKVETAYSIEFFDKFEDYLKKMASCRYTLALTVINEGWNRVAHESLLMGTQVIGYDHGGLGELLKGSNALIAQNINEVYDLIKNDVNNRINKNFLMQYEKVQSIKFIEPIVKFLNEK
ncbi:MAG: hypothetical protein Q8M15_08410 [Bacteroidota bacterium]|nr:hypothetical protein [Bacteroidota bacterium]